MRLTLKRDRDPSRHRIIESVKRQDSRRFTADKQAHPETPLLSRAISTGTPLRKFSP